MFTKTTTINQITQEDMEHWRTSCDYMSEENSMDYYQEIATKSAFYPGQGTPFGLMYCALGLSEAGEVQGKVKKAFRDDCIIELEPDVTVGEDVMTYITIFHPLTDKRKAELTKELGGTLWYLVATCKELGIKLSDVATVNLEEIFGRTERGTLRGSGDDR